MKLRYATIALALSTAFIAPAGLQAQFTTFVPKPTKAAVDSARPATVAAAKARADSVTRMSITSMKEWVDSAAGIAANDTTAAAAAVATTTVASNTATTSSTSTRATTTFSNGAIAPSTASPLPTYLAAGFASLAAGILLLVGLRRRPKAALAKQHR